jgi:hypothetical protein
MDIHRVFPFYRILASFESGRGILIPMAHASIEWLSRWKKKLGIMVVGHTFKQIEEFLFDYTLYPLVIAWLGPIRGGVVMTVLSMAVCYVYLIFYDWSKQDWLGVEVLKEMRDRDGYEGVLARFFQKAIRKSHWVAFIILSIQADPFVTTIYMRNGAHGYNGLSARDWRVFFGSVAVSNLWWIGIVALAVEGIRYLIHIF